MRYTDDKHPMYMLDKHDLEMCTGYILYTRLQKDTKKGRKERLRYPDTQKSLSLDVDIKTQNAKRQKKNIMRNEDDILNPLRRATPDTSISKCCMCINVSAHASTMRFHNHCRRF